MKTLTNKFNLIATTCALLFSAIITLPVFAETNLSPAKTQQMIDEQVSRLALHQQVVYFKHEIELEAQFDMQLTNADKQFVREKCISHDLVFDNTTTTCIQKSPNDK